MTYWLHSIAQNLHSTVEVQHRSTAQVHYDAFSVAPPGTNSRSLLRFSTLSCTSNSVPEFLERSWLLLIPHLTELEHVLQSPALYLYVCMYICTCLAANTQPTMKRAHGTKNGLNAKLYSCLLSRLVACSVKSQGRVRDRQRNRVLSVPPRPSFVSVSHADLDSFPQCPSLSL